MELLQAAWKPDRGPLVAEVALDLARNGQGREGRELVAKVGIEAIDSLDEAEVADLHDVVQRLASVLKLSRQEVDEVSIGVNKLRANAIAFCGVRCLLVATVEGPQLLTGQPRLGSQYV